MASIPSVFLYVISILNIGLSSLRVIQRSRPTNDYRSLSVKKHFFRCGDGTAFRQRVSELRQHHLEAGETDHQVCLADIAHVGETDDLSFKMSLTSGDRDAEFL